MMLSHGITTHTDLQQIGQTLWSNLPQVLGEALFFNLACYGTPSANIGTGVPC